VVVYSSVDDVYVRPVAEMFTRRTGVQVKLVLDTEETKSTGLLNRLLAESARPQADVFWSGDPVRAAVLKRRGLAEPFSPQEADGLEQRFSDPEHQFTSFSARLRVIIFNQKLLGTNQPPKSIFDLASPRFARRACLANPLFGTTSMHAAALFQVLGVEKATEFFEQLTTNGVRMLSSNGEVRRRVSAGDFDIGLTDSDDVNVALRDGQPVGFALPDQDGMGTLLMPNATVLLRGAPHARNGESFINFLTSAEVEKFLATSEAAQIPLRHGLAVPALFGKELIQIRLMAVDYPKLAAEFESLSDGFLEKWVRQQNSAGIGGGK
jgi:iron(III) transport system substrate-binding protein